MDNELQTLRHTASHILAQAVKRLYPQAKLAIGPAIENGFYYDIDMPVSVTPEVLAQLARLHGVSADYLLELTDDPAPREPRLGPVRG